MPYNIAAIPQPEDITGSAALPSRVKKILAVDEEIGAVSANASFAITIATEMFIRYIADQAHNVVRSEKKSRRQIQYKDLANAVSRIDNLSFLEDIVPRTTTYKEFKTRKTRAANVDNMTIANGQTRLDASSGALDKLAPSSYDPYDAVSVGPGGKGSQDLIQAPGSADTGPRTRDQQLIFEHYEPSGNRVDQPGDIDMG